MGGARNHRALSSLLGAFPPSEWKEDLFVKTPPFVTEDVRGGLLLEPTRSGSSSLLDDLSIVLGLKKRNNGEVQYVANRSDVIRSIRTFLWFVRRSWKNKEYGVMWAIIYTGQRNGWTNFRIPLESIGELTGIDPDTCKRVMENLLGGRTEPAAIYGFNEYVTDKEHVWKALDRLVKETPSWTEEQLMLMLCSGTGASVAQIYEQLLARGLSIGAVYKAVERLKDSDFILPTRHVRVKERGPMRELLSPGCRNCFFGYTSEDRCFQDTFRQLEYLLQRHYHKGLTGESRANLYREIRSMPFSPRMVRRLIDALNLIFQVERKTSEGGVSTMIKKLEERYDIELPLKTINESEDYTIVLN